MTRIAILCNDRLAIPALAALLQAGRVAAVGMAHLPSEIRPVVEKLCLDAGVSCVFFHKEQLEQQLQHWLVQHRPDVVLVKTFPWKIPAALLNIPRLGFINFHYAPLPAWRGANPLFWMIRNRVPVGGITIHHMDASFDTGPIILQAPVPISPDVSFGMLNTQLAFGGMHLLQHLLPMLDACKLPSIPQAGAAHWYRKPVAADLLIDWATMAAADVKALVKACNPWNKGAATSWNGWMFGITDASVVAPAVPIVAKPGRVMALDAQQGLLIACVDGLLLKAEVVYCEEGFFAGHQLTTFGLSLQAQLGLAPMAAVASTADREAALA